MVSPWQLDVMITFILSFLLPFYIKKNLNGKKGVIIIKIVVVIVVVVVVEISETA